ncbi:hypothetical protein SAMN05216285_1773 [Natrinema salifodinae]|uniref:Uncharacterized protein n=1 Tax=Natrinema salifodinae TaxID=1202768 RepID=A0A1I0NIF1_9EURY|nr:hypothetical protein SAMN05216285_1773 [Natrinema salifodinae]
MILIPYIESTISYSSTENSSREQQPILFLKGHFAFENKAIFSSLTGVSEKTDRVG